MKRFLIALFLCMAGTVAHAQLPVPPTGTKFYCVLPVNPTEDTVGHCLGLLNSLIEGMAGPPCYYASVTIGTPFWINNSGAYFLKLPFVASQAHPPGSCTDPNIGNANVGDTTLTTCPDSSSQGPNNSQGGMTCYCPDKHTSTTTYHQYWSPDWNECFPSLWDVIHLQPNGQ